MEAKVEFKSLKDRIKFFSGQNNSNKPKIDNKNKDHINSNKPNADNKNTVNNNSNQEKVDNKGIKNNISNNVKFDNNKNQNIPKIENNKIIGNYLLKEKENMNIYKYPKK